MTMRSAAMSPSVVRSAVFAGSADTINKSSTLSSARVRQRNNKANSTTSSSLLFVGVRHASAFLQSPPPTRRHAAVVVNASNKFRPWFLPQDESQTDDAAGSLADTTTKEDDIKLFEPVEVHTRIVLPDEAVIPDADEQGSEAAKPKIPSSGTVKKKLDVLDIPPSSDDENNWDVSENTVTETIKKGSMFVYGGGAVAVAGGAMAVWVSSTVVGAVNAVPLLPKVMEVIGLLYSSWFCYRYLLFKSARTELIDDVEELKAKITGSKKYLE